MEGRKGRGGEKREGVNTLVFLEINHCTQSSGE